MSTEFTRVGPTVPCDPRRPFEFKHEVRAMGVPVPGDDGVLVSDGMVLPRPVPGTWYTLNPGEAPYTVCPECGHGGRLGQHRIGPDGTISPSIVCPLKSCGDGVVRCTAHYYGKLLDWRPV